MHRIAKRTRSFRVASNIQRGLGTAAQQPQSRRQHSMISAAPPSSIFPSTSMQLLSFHSLSIRQFSGQKASPPRKRTAGKHSFIPQKAAVNLTEQARTFFKQLLDKPPRPDIVGIMLYYDQSKQHGDMRMVFSFDFVTPADIDLENDEAVSLEVLEDGTTAKPYVDSLNDGLSKLYVHHNAFMKVLGATVDVDLETLTPVLHDREGNLMDPNA
ncbi:hypothetical protein MPSEU_001093900 [Mayamaea pseudoterrestris]|nr:hypothetical protein MPSEU_001093900 [Mayamaea pseudoterrestris]